MACIHSRAWTQPRWLFPLSVPKIVTQPPCPKEQKPQTCKRGPPQRLTWASLWNIHGFIDYVWCSCTVMKYLAAHLCHKLPHPSIDQARGKAGMFVQDSRTGLQHTTLPSAFLWKVPLSPSSFLLSVLWKMLKLPPPDPSVSLAPYPDLSVDSALLFPS